MVNVLLNFFKDYRFSVEEFNEIVSKAHQVDIKKGTRILAAGHICDKIWVLVNGGVRCYFTDETGYQKTIWVKTTGSVFQNTESFLKQQPSTSSIDAITDCRLIYFTREDIYKMYDKIPEFNRFARILIEQSFLYVIDLISITHHKDPMVRYSMWINNHQDILPITPQHMIADMINVSPVHLSRLKSAYAKTRMNKSE